MAHTEPTHIEHIHTQYIPPEVFTGRRNMNNFYCLESISRKCHICNRPLKWHEFIQTAREKGNIEKFGIKMLKQIWENIDLFLLKCCRCYRKANSDVLDARQHPLIRGIQRCEHVWEFHRDDLNGEIYRICRRCNSRRDEHDGYR